MNYKQINMSIFGESNSGKSTLLNILANNTIVPMQKYKNNIILETKLVKNGKFSNEEIIYEQKYIPKDNVIKIYGTGQFKNEIYPNIDIFIRTFYKIPYFENSLTRTNQILINNHILFGIIDINYCFKNSELKIINLFNQITNYTNINLQFIPKIIFIITHIDDDNLKHSENIKILDDYIKNNAKFEYDFWTCDLFNTYIEVVQKNKYIPQELVSKIYDYLFGKFSNSENKLKTIYEFQYDSNSNDILKNEIAKIINANIGQFQIYNIKYKLFLNKNKLSNQEILLYMSHIAKIHDKYNTSHNCQKDIKWISKYKKRICWLF